MTDKVAAPSTGKRAVGAAVKIVVIGGGAVGKSATVVRFIQGNFVERYDPTIEDSYRRNIEVDNTTCVVDVVDTAGQEGYSALREQYMRVGEGFVLVFSIISRASFENVKKMQPQIIKIRQDMTHSNVKPPMVLVGNKKDMEEKRQVTEKEAKEYCDSVGITHYFESSAKNNENIEETFAEVVRQVLEHRKTNVNHKKQKKERKKNCIIV